MAYEWIINFSFGMLTIKQSHTPIYKCLTMQYLQTITENYQEHKRNKSDVNICLDFFANICEICTCNLIIIITLLSKFNAQTVIQCLRKYSKNA